MNTYDTLRGLVKGIGKELSDLDKKEAIPGHLGPMFLALRVKTGEVLNEFKKYAQLQKELTDTVQLAKKAKQRNNHEGANILQAKAEALSIELVRLTDYWLSELTETKTAQQGELFK